MGCAIPSATGDGARARLGGGGGAARGAPNPRLGAALTARARMRVSGSSSSLALVAAAAAASGATTTSGKGSAAQPVSPAYACVTSSPHVNPLATPRRSRRRLTTSGTVVACSTVRMSRATAAGGVDGDRGGVPVGPPSLPPLSLPSLPPPPSTPPLSAATAPRPTSGTSSVATAGRGAGRRAAGRRGATHWRGGTAARPLVDAPPHVRVAKCMVARRSRRGQAWGASPALVSLGRDGDGAACARKKTKNKKHAPPAQSLQPPPHTQDPPPRRRWGVRGMRGVRLVAGPIAPGGGKREREREWFCWGPPKISVAVVSGGARHTICLCV